MKKFGYIALALSLTLGLVAVAQAGQTILKAFAPAGSDGTSVILQVDWAQVKQANPEITQVSLRRRAAGPPKPLDTLVTLPVDSARYTDTGLDKNVMYHYFAYFKDAEGNTLKFGSSRAVVHLGPISTLPAKP